MPPKVPVALAIAGTDSGGGAGLAADLLTFAAHRVFGTIAVAAITVQNTREITRSQAVAADLLSDQIHAVFSDFSPTAVKIGMLATAANVSATARALRKWKAKNIVLDPVLLSTTGVRLLAPSAVAPLKKELIPLTAVLTPNLPEAEALVGFPIRDEGDRRLAAGVLADLGAGSVLLKGGHSQGNRISDLFFDGKRFLEFHNFRLATTATHGTGCALSSAIAANLARGAKPAEAVKNGIEYLRSALKRGIFPGQGFGTPGHY